MFYLLTSKSLAQKVGRSLCDNERQRTHKLRPAFWVHGAFDGYVTDA
tara:strand:- start:644 stop:784 length:141 start_codon:yes stop_codon:yes gene_type:complete